MTVTVVVTRTETSTATVESDTQAALFTPYNVAVYSWSLVVAVFLPTIFAMLVGAVDIFRKRSLSGKSFEEPSKSDETIEKYFIALMK